MKKYLLGALLVLGTMAYGQDNRVITPVDAQGNATANLGIEVTGKVFSPADLSLVVEIKSAASAAGTGFAFEMPNMFAKTEDSKTAQGDFEAYLLEADVRKPFETNKLAINLVQDGAVVTGNTTSTAEASGTATGVQIDYTLIGGSGDIADLADKTSHDGAVVVKAVTTQATEVGTYTDSSVQLRVALSK